jgi:hypothetical protein
MREYRGVIGGQRLRLGETAICFDIHGLCQACEEKMCIQETQNIPSKTTENAHTTTTTTTSQDMNTSVSPFAHRCGSATASISRHCAAISRGMRSIASQRVRVSVRRRGQCAATCSASACEVTRTQAVRSSRQRRDDDGDENGDGDDDAKVEWDDACDEDEEAKEGGAEESAEDDDDCEDEVCAISAKDASEHEDDDADGDGEWSWLDGLTASQK